MSNSWTRVYILLRVIIQRELATVSKLVALTNTGVRGGAYCCRAQTRHILVIERASTHPSRVEGCLDGGKRRQDRTMIPPPLHGPSQFVEAVFIGHSDWIESAGPRG